MITFTFTTPKTTGEVENSDKGVTDVLVSAGTAGGNTASLHTLITVKDLTVSEPSTFWLVLLGAAGLLGYRKLIR